MRTLIFAINMTIDGNCHHTKLLANDEIYDFYTPLLRDTDLLLYGRKTYQLMVPFWPDVAKTQSMSKPANDFAQAFDSIPKLVVSQSLSSVEDKNTTILRANLQDEIQKLKRAPGKTIMTGGVALPSHLMKLGLVDEFRFLIHPVLAGEGTRLLEGMTVQEKFQLTLAESKTFKSGCVALRYVKH